MRRRFFVYFLIITLITVSITVMGIVIGHFSSGKSVDVAARRHSGTLVLLPLDSRPACTQFVSDLAALAGLQVVTPPAELMDNYTKPADRAALKMWLRDSVIYADAAIISTDMLLSGSLLASRTAIPTQAEIDEIAALLTDIRRNNPHIRLYSFHIIPRLLIADHSPDRQYQKLMQNYSVLQDRLLQFENPLDYKKLSELEERLPAKVIKAHRLLYERNQDAHRAWLRLVEEKVLDGLVIGQDDGYPFGLPNLVKQRMQSEADHKNLRDKVIITRGTDEVAITLLGRLALEQKAQPRVFVEYSTPDAPQVVMPFMPHSVATTVDEKLRLIGARKVQRLEEADFVLYVHIGRQSSTPYRLHKAANRLFHLVNANYPVAFVDLTEDYYAHETLLPYAIKENVDITKLVAYAGWNTTSNSIGTAVTQAALYTSLQPSTSPERLRHFVDNLHFLTARFLDDWYYLKHVQPRVNKELRKLGIDPYRLRERKEQTETFVRREMQQSTYHFLRSTMIGKTFSLSGSNQSYMIDRVEYKLSLPWERTFEIQLVPRISIQQVTNLWP